MIKTVIFDIDGTMYDYEAGNRIAMAALQNYCEEQFAIDGETFRRVFGEANRLMAERIGSVSAAIHNRLIRFQYILEQLQQPPFPHARTMYHIYWDTLIDAMRRSEGLVEWLRELHRQGIRIGVGSNMTSYIQYRKLEHLGVAPFVDWMVTSEEVGCEKPEPRFFRLCLEKSGVQPQECLFVGDSLKNDVEGALGVGMRALLYAPEGAENTRPGTRGRRYEVIHSYRECLAEDFLSRFLLAEE